MHKLLIVAVVLIWVVVPWARSDAQAPQPQSWCVSVWYPSSEHPGGYDSILNNIDVIHEVNPFWYSPTPDGDLNVGQNAEDPAKLAAWRDANLLILPTIVSFHMSAMIEDPDVRARHIENIVDLVERMDYDGIDIDYESFGLHTRDDFSAFIEDLAVALHANDRLLSMAVHAKTADSTTWWEGAAAQDWNQLAPAVDVFRIMTYDYHGGTSEPGPIGPPVWSSEVLDYAASIVPLEKVRLGLHFYGYSWRRSDAVPVPWESVNRWVEQFDLTIERDPADMEAQMTFKVQGLPRQTVVVADAESLAFKLAMIRETHPTLGGVAIWGLGGEDPENWGVLQDYLVAECSQSSLAGSQ